MASIGENIKYYRKKTGITQARLAERAGISEKSISFYEHGKRQIPSAYLMPFAKALGITVDELITGPDEEKTAEDELLARVLADIRELLKDYEIVQK